MLNQDVKIIHPMECKCLAMKPIFAGALVAIGLSFLLNLFSVAIGLNAYTINSQGIENLAFGGLIATALGVVVAMFASGWLAGYLGKRHCPLGHLGALYGFLTWCVALIASILLFGFFVRYIGFYTQFISGVPYVMHHTMPAAMNTVAQVSGVTNPESKVVLSTYIVFVLFFLGAIASSFGGHAGMRHRCKMCRDEMNK